MSDSKWQAIAKARATEDRELLAALRARDGAVKVPVVRPRVNLAIRPKKKRR